MTRNLPHLALAALAAALLSWPATVSAETLCVKAAKANLRAGPAATHRVTWEVPRNMPLVEATREGEWIKVVDLDGDIHWVFGGAVAKGARCAVVRAAKTSLRKEPSAKAATLKAAERYESFPVTGEKGPWLKLDFNGQPAWAAAADFWRG